MVTNEQTSRLHHDDAIRFGTYRNYLHRFWRQSEDAHETWEAFAAVCAHATRSLRPIKEPEIAWLQRFLGIAWNTETLIIEQPTEVDLIRINNAWLPVQAYYAVYAMAEAVAYVIDGVRANGHHKALRKVTDLLVKLSVSPWNLAYRGACGRDGKQHRPCNFPKDLVPAHNLSEAAGHLEIIATCLRAEHGNRIKEDYKRRSKFKYQYDPGHTGLLHFLYRLRIRSNYRGVELFIVEGADHEIRSFSESLRWIVSHTMTYFEIILVRKCSRQVIVELAERFIAKNRRAKELADRIAFYRRLS